MAVLRQSQGVKFICPLSWGITDKFPYQNGIEHSVHLINPFSHMSLKICIIDLNLLTKNCLEINSIFVTKLLWNLVTIFVPQILDFETTVFLSL